MTSHDIVQSNITGFWSTVAPQYETRPGNVPTAGSAEHRAWIAALRELLPDPPAQVLDVGTGTGFAALAAAASGHAVTGIDLAQPMLDVARAEAKGRGLDVCFRLKDAVDPQLPPASWDAIVCRHFLWTLREPELALRNWLSLLRPGGRVVAIDGFWFAPTVGAEEVPSLFDQYYTPETRAALPAMGLDAVGPILQLFERAGFVQVAVTDLAGVHALAENPPSAEPWYVVVARRPG
jgi:SAM-dependent methyltransferase